MGDRYGTAEAVPLKFMGDCYGTAEAVPLSFVVNSFVGNDVMARLKRAVNRLNCWNGNAVGSRSDLRFVPISRIPVWEGKYAILEDGCYVMRFAGLERTRSCRARE